MTASTIAPKWRMNDLYSLKGRAVFVGNASGIDTSIANITQRENEALKRELYVSKPFFPTTEKCGTKSHIIRDGCILRDFPHYCGRSHCA